MRTGSLLLVGEDSRFVSVAEEAAGIALAGATIAKFSNLDEALASKPTGGPTVLALWNPADADVSRAVRTLGSTGLPRWAVVLLRPNSPDPDAAEAVALEDWNVAWVSRVFRSSAALHLLKRENAALRGDLLTMGRRVAHDLRTPLGCIAVATEALRESLAKRLPECLALSEPIAESGDELTELIRRISLLARATARGATEQRVEMGVPVLAVLERLRKEILEKGAVLSEPASWPGVAGDENLLEAVWWNLVSNALRHSGKKPRIELGWKREDEDYRFWVSDKGGGVPVQNRKSLFQPFYQLHELNAVRGFGLPIVQRLVELQGGRCGYESLPSGGARFFFTLPAKSG
jgi:signal transduction histidine kinase